jgi:ADP-heptose:LPS heptosyltransferase
LIGVHPAARDPRKIWPPERFALTARRLRKQAGGTIVIIGGPEERDLRLGERMASLCDGSPVVNLAGRQSLPEMGAVISRLDVLVTNDSGPAHIAYALGTPTVTVFGFTDPAEWGPLDPERHRVVAPFETDIERQPPEQRMLSIGIDQVARAAQEVMRAA